MRPTIRFCIPTLILTVGVMLIFLAIPAPKKPVLVAGSDLFWETYEAQFGACPCPPEDRATDRLRGLGYEVEP